MSEINLQEGKIEVDGEWLSVEELTKRIQEKIDAGDMKFSGIAAALEELNSALENSHTIETSIVIPKADYEKLKSLGGGDDLECVRRAILAFIGGGVKEGRDPEPKPEAEGKKKKTIKCAKCKAAIEINGDDIPAQIECPECGTIGRLKAQNKG